MTEGKARYRTIFKGYRDKEMLSANTFDTPEEALEEAAVGRECGWPSSYAISYTVLEGE